MNPDQQMRDIKEAAGEGWHNKIFATTASGRGEDRTHLNPSPTDLNELLRLAAKIGINNIRVNLTLEVIPSDHYVADITADTAWVHNVNYTYADALRSAIWQAIQEVK